ncbi:cutinase transcription factor 1 beta [Fusarium langsethiae]|uniref:Cutinase transcription factor 1 beta n=1 Tax=Fusarium langsethiae TaxID=179993 RepID=A0A0N0DC56_FUSLA|nr:cutinase transcription factor 1 beta [Fusarium langsethiae]
MIEKFQDNFAKPKPKRQDTRKRSPKKNIDKPDASEEDTERLAKPLRSPKEGQDAPAVLTDQCFGTPKLAEARSRRTPTRDHTHARPEITFAYYPFLCISNLSSLYTDDVKYLESQGCFRVPESHCLDDLILTFFRYAHPILPVINEAEFWSIYDPLFSDGNTTRIPVILLSAMIFVACKYVGESTLQGMQLGSVHEAQNIFLRKTQLLYDQETESSPLVLAQVSLLLAQWTSQRSSRSSRQSTHWLGRAIRHSQDAISQAKLWNTLKIRYNQSNLRRLLGCCILSDCIHSLYTRRPLMMPLDMIEAESDYPVLSRADLSHEIGRSRVYGVEAKQKLIDAQEQLSALVNILRRVLAMVYSQDCHVGALSGRTLAPRGESSRNLFSLQAAPTASVP